VRQSAPRQRLILKAQKIREQLGGNLGLLDVFPDKPKGMHQKRYNRLRCLHDQAVERSLGIVAPLADQMLRRVAATSSAGRGR
jgi:hypothetical protein